MNKALTGLRTAWLFIDGLGWMVVAPFMMIGGIASAAINHPINNLWGFAAGAAAVPLAGVAHAATSKAPNFDIEDIFTDKFIGLAAAFSLGLGTITGAATKPPTVNNYGVDGSGFYNNEQGSSKPAPLPTPCKFVQIRKSPKDGLTESTCG